jgi:hypothetical protein
LLNIFIYYTYFSDKQRISYPFYKICTISEMFLEIKLRRRDFLYWGLFDPKPLIEGPEAHSQATLASSARTAMAMAGTSQGPKKGGAPVREEEGEGVQENRSLTRRSPVHSVRPEEDGRR